MEKAKRNTVILLVLAVLLFGVVTAFLLNFAQNDEKTSAEVPAAQPTANDFKSVPMEEHFTFSPIDEKGHSVTDDVIYYSNGDILPKTASEAEKKISEQKSKFYYDYNYCINTGKPGGAFGREVTFCNYTLFFGTKIYGDGSNNNGNRLLPYEPAMPDRMLLNCEYGGKLYTKYGELASVCNQLDGYTSLYRIGSMGDFVFIECGYSGYARVKLIQKVYDKLDDISTISVGLSYTFKIKSITSVDYNSYLFSTADKICRISYYYDGKCRNIKNLENWMFYNTKYEKKLPEAVDLNFDIPANELFMGWGLGNYEYGYVLGPNEQTADYQVFLHAHTISKESFNVEYFSTLNGATLNILNKDKLSFKPVDGMILPTAGEVEILGEKANELSLIGWYDNKECAGEKITNIEKYTEKNMNFYAKLSDKYFSLSVEKNINNGHYPYLKFPVELPKIYNSELGYNLPSIDSIELNSNWCYCLKYYLKDDPNKTSITGIAPNSKGNKTVVVEVVQHTFELDFRTELSYKGITITQPANFPGYYKINVGFTLPEPSDVTLSDVHYKVVGWYFSHDASKTPITSIEPTATGDLIVIAKLELCKWDITYETDIDGVTTTLPSSAPLLYEKNIGCTLTAITDVTLSDAHYRVAGWYLKDDASKTLVTSIEPTATGEKTVVAKLEQYKWDIIYETEVARFKITNVADKLYEPGKEFALPASDTIVVQQEYGRYQYRIVKWYLKGDASKKPITIIPSTATGNQTVVGIAEQRTFEVRLYDLGNVYDVIGGAGDYGYYNSQKLPTVSEIKVSESSKKYRFLGWYFDMYFAGEPITEIPANYMPTSEPNKYGDREINIYPKFEQYIFKITYAYENWKGLPNYNMIDGLCEYENGVGLTLWGCIAQVSFVDFDGWYLKEDVTIDENGKEVIHLITKIEPTAMGNKTLYARCHINVDIYNTERAGTKDPFEPDFNIETDGAISEKKIDTMHFQQNGVLSKTDLEKYDKSKLPYYVFDKYIVRYQRADGTATVITQSEFPSADMVVVYDENIKKMDIVLSYKQAPGTLSIQPIICGFADKNNTIKDYVLTPFAAIPGWNVMLSPEIYAFNQKTGARAGALYKFVCWSIVPTTATDWNAKKQVKPFNADSLLTLTSDVKIYANFEKIANTYCDTQNILTSQADEAAFLQLYENTETVPEEKPSDKPTTPDEVINDITVKFDKMLSKVKVVFELQKSVTYKWNNIGAKDFWSVYNFKVYAVALGGLLALIAIIMIIKLLVVFFRTLTRPINKAYKKSQRKRR